MSRLAALLGIGMLLVAVFAFQLVARPQVVLAVDPNEAICNNLVDPSNPPSICTSATKNDPVTGARGLFPTIIQLVIFLTGAISVIMIIIGGFRYVLSAGDSNSLQGAKNTILYALVGLIVAVFSQTIVSFVLSKL